MAKIIYGVAGEGFGHSSRSHLIGQRLLNAGHDVLFVASEKSYNYLKRYFPGRLVEISGLFLKYNNRDLCAFRTFFANTSKFPATVIRNIKQFQNYLNPFKPDLVITDFEPFSASWAYWNKVPLLSIDHEHILTNCKIDKFKSKGFARFNSQLVTKGYLIKAASHIVLSFVKLPVKYDTTIVAPPVIREIVKQYKPAEGRHVVYYSVDRTDWKRTVETFNKFPDTKFIIYGQNENAQYGNCTLKETSTEDFLTDMSTASAVIATAGFSLLSESIHLRKRMLLLPVQGQFEQMLNAYYAEKLNIAVSSDKLDKKTLGRFLETLDQTRFEDDRIIFPDNDKFFDVLETELNGLGISAKPIEEYAGAVKTA